MMNKTKVLYGILISQWVDCAWEAYLTNRQLKKATATKEMPHVLRGIMAERTFEKTRLYNIDKMKYELVGTTVSTGILTYFLYKGWLAHIWQFIHGMRAKSDGEVTTTCIWLLTVTALQTVFSIPFEMYETFQIEKKHGFNKATMGVFLVNQFLMFIVSQTLILPLSSFIIFVIKYTGKFFFLWLWLAFGSLTLLFATIYPTVIAPMYDEIQPLQEGNLRTQIEALAAELNFPLSQLYVVKNSDRSSHSNAYFAGMFNHKAIVLFDTLFENPRGGCTNEEILAILCHEMGHWHYNHMVMNIILAEVNLLILFMSFAWFFKSPLIYEAIGFKPGTQPVLIGLMVTLDFILLPYNVFMRCLATWMSRKMEFQADHFAVTQGRGRALASALTKLYRDNLEYPIYDRMYSKWHHSHPQLLERLEAIYRYN